MNDYDESLGGIGLFGGQVIGGPGVARNPQTGFLALFGRGTDNALWWAKLGMPSPPWNSLGGTLTSRSGAAGNGTSLDVVVRGADGAVWHCALTSNGWSPWASLGGRVLAGSSPAAVYVGGALYVAFVGSDHALWLNSTADGALWSGWRSLGGRLTSGVGAATTQLGYPHVTYLGVIGTDGNLWHNFGVLPHLNGWTRVPS